MVGLQRGFLRLCSLQDRWQCGREGGLGVTSHSNSSLPPFPPSSLPLTPPLSFVSPKPGWSAFREVSFGFALFKIDRSAAGEEDWRPAWSAFREASFGFARFKIDGSAAGEADWDFVPPKPAWSAFREAAIGFALFKIDGSAAGEADWE
ncbi:unnamed protein product [Closterium sp. Naga37s-1]|nr:unnamed protein product [Closterium sp. Naga37s-1]